MNDQTTRPRGAVPSFVLHTLCKYNSTNDTIIEVGCGAKRFAPHLQGHYAGLDIATNYGSPPDVFGDAQRLPFRDECADLMFSVSVLLIVPDALKALREARRVLKPGGVYLVIDYNWWVARRLRRADPSHRHIFTPLSLAALMRRAGLEPSILLPYGGTDPLKRIVSRIAPLRVLGAMVWRRVVVAGRKA